MRLPPLHECTKHLSLILNVRGLNQRARRDTVHQIIAATSCNIACLQETKLFQICQYDASYLGGYRLHQAGIGTFSNEGEHHHPMEQMPAKLHRHHHWRIPRLGERSTEGLGCQLPAYSGVWAIMAYGQATLPR